jgi:hypothetical protein
LHFYQSSSIFRANMISSTEGEVMPKKKNRGNEQIKWAKYRWEFMRHNPEDIKAYEEVKILRSKADPSPDKVKKTKCITVYFYLNTPEAKTEKNFVRSLGFILIA